MSKNRLLQIVNKLGLTNKDKSDLVNIIDAGGNGGNSSNKELYAYPVDSLDGKENKVVELGSDAMYQYVGELVASEDGPTEGVVGEVFNTTYCHQPIRDGKYYDSFEPNLQDKYFTLYVGNDVDGYFSNKVYMSEDANNLTYYDFYFIAGFAPINLKVAISPDYMLHYKNYFHYANKNSKVFFAPAKQQLDVNLIPQEIARKEDIEIEINNHEYPVVTVDADNLTYSGQLGTKIIRININISTTQFDNNTLLNLLDDNKNFYRYGNNNIDIIFSRVNNNIIDINLIHPVFTANESALGWLDYKKCNITNGQCFVVTSNESFYPATIGRDNFITTLINGKYFKYTLNRETHLLELQSELDLNSIESRLAALESKI